MLIWVMYCSILIPYHTLYQWYIYLSVHLSISIYMFVIIVLLCCPFKLQLHFFLMCFHAIRFCFSTTDDHHEKHLHLAGKCCDVAIPGSVRLHGCQ